jgi:hypothetical protein
MSAVGNLIKKAIIDPVKTIVSGVINAVGKGIECMKCLAQGDLKGAMTNFMEGMKSAMQAVDAASNLVPGLKMTPMGMFKSKLMGLADSALDAGVDVLKTGGKNLNRIAMNAVMDALPKPSNFMPPSMQIAMAASRLAA